MSDSSAIRIVHPREFDRGTLQTPGSGTPVRGCAATRRRNDVVGRLVRSQAGCSHGNPSSWRSADHRVRVVRHMQSALGRERQIRSMRGGRRFHSRACVSATHADQSVRFATVPMGLGEKYVDSDRGQSSRRHVAIVSRRPERGQGLAVHDNKGRRIETRNEGPPWMKTDTPVFRPPDERFGTPALSTAAFVLGCFRGSRYPPRHRTPRRQSSPACGTAT
jgi:hypothetical protein